MDSTHKSGNSILLTEIFFLATLERHYSVTPRLDVHMRSVRMAYVLSLTLFALCSFAQQIAPPIPSTNVAGYKIMAPLAQTAIEKALRNPKP